MRSWSEIRITSSLRNTSINGSTTLGNLFTLVPRCRTNAQQMEMDKWTLDLRVTKLQLTGQQARPSTSFDNTVDLQWRNCSNPEFGTKFQTPEGSAEVFSRLLEFPQDRSKEASTPKMQLYVFNHFDRIPTCNRQTHDYRVRYHSIMP